MPSSPQTRAAPRRFLDGLAHLLVLLLVVLLVLLLRILAVVFFPFRHRPSVSNRVQFLFRKILLAAWSFLDRIRVVRVRYEGEPDRPPVILVANHPSFVDALLLIPRLPTVSCVYKASLERIFFPRSLGKCAGFISNAGALDTIRAAVARLRGGWSVLLFPEGTRTSRFPMSPWKSSFAIMAMQAKAPVQPVFIDMDPPLFPKGTPWWRPPGYPVRVTVRFGLPIQPNERHTARDFHREVEAGFRHDHFHEPPSTLLHDDRSTSRSR